ncbi:MAG: peptidoglycan-associated lipoprotein [Chlamydiae bacterium]|nr:MAG: peptidoglycan-associated lipoprotein [Chlamydiota bacterium]
MDGQPFNLEQIDNDVLGGDSGIDGDQSFPGDLKAADGTGMRFVEPGSGSLPPEIDREAQQVLQDIHFPYNSSTIMPEDAGVLQQIAAFLKHYPQVVLQIEGHCDERGTEEYNMALGSRRAGAARQFLVDLSINPNRLYTISYGEEKPFDPGNNEQAWAVNRRDHFLVGVAGE